jgi:hypothetical protein
MRPGCYGNMISVNVIDPFRRMMSTFGEEEDVQNKANSCGFDPAAHTNGLWLTRGILPETKSGERE